MMAGWALLASGILLLLVTARIGRHGARGLAQGAAVLTAALGVLLLLRRPGSVMALPGFGPRRWHQP